MDAFGRFQASTVGIASIEFASSSMVVVTPADKETVRNICTNRKVK